MAGLLESSVFDVIFSSVVPVVVTSQMQLTRVLVVSGCCFHGYTVALLVLSCSIVNNEIHRKFHLCSLNIMRDLYELRINSEII